jgi:hypothetical protein
MPEQADRQTYNIAHNRLLRYYNPDEGNERFQRQLRLEGNNDRYYHAIVNYLTGMMVQVLLRLMRGALWEEQCVVTIAKFAAKLKILINNLPISASTCLSRTEEVRFRNFHQAKIESTMGYGDQALDDGKLLPPRDPEQSAASIGARFNRRRDEIFYCYKNFLSRHLPSFRFGAFKPQLE